MIDVRHDYDVMRGFCQQLSNVCHDESVMYGFCQQLSHVCHDYKYTVPCVVSVKTKLCHD